MVLIRRTSLVPREQHMKPFCLHVFGFFIIVAADFSGALSHSAAALRPLCPEDTQTAEPTHAALASGTPHPRPLNPALHSSAHPSTQHHLIHTLRHRGLKREPCEALTSQVQGGRGGGQGGRRVRRRREARKGMRVRKKKMEEEE